MWFFVRDPVLGMHTIGLLDRISNRDLQVTPILYFSQSHALDRNRKMPTIHKWSAGSDKSLQLLVDRQNRTCLRGDHGILLLL